MSERVRRTIPPRRTHDQYGRERGPDRLPPVSSGTLAPSRQPVRRGGCQLIYRRDDLPREVAQERLEALRINLTWEWNPPKTPALEEFGGEQASLQIRDQTVILHLPVEADHGLLIGLEPGAVRDLTSFMTDCMQHVDGIDAPA